MNNSLNIYQRLNKAKEAVSSVAKAEKTMGMKYRPMLHDDVTSETRSALMNNGIFVKMDIKSRVQNGNRTEIDAVMWFINQDNPEDRVSIDTCGYGIDDQDKGPGKAISYAFKYGLLKGLMLKTGDDPELDQQTEFKSDQKSDPVQKPHALLGKIYQLLKDDAPRQAKVLNYYGYSSFTEMPQDVLNEVYDYLTRPRQGKGVA